jgi:hypothetical protein
VAAVLSGSAVVGFLSLALASALGAAWLVAPRAPSGGSVTTAAAVLAALVLVGFEYASLPAASALLIAAAPAAAWLTRPGPVRRLNPWARGVIEAVAVLVPIGVAVAIAARESPPYGY